MQARFFVEVFGSLKIEGFLNHHAPILYSGVRLYLNPHFGDWWIEDISKFNIAEFKSKLIQVDRSDSIKHFTFSALKTIFKKAKEWDLIADNPAEFEKPPKKGMSRMEYWTESEVKVFLSYIAGHARLPIYLLVFNTGMRVGEIFGLKWDCVDLENGMMTIKRMYCQKSNSMKETTKTRRYRQIGINDTLHNLLIGLKSKATGEFVIETKGSRDTSRMAHIFAKDCKEAGVRVIRFHDLRHTFATQFVMNNGSIHALAGMLGHTGITMTSKYAHFGPEHARRAAKVVSCDVPKPAEVIQLHQSRRKSTGTGQELVTE